MKNSLVFIAIPFFFLLIGVELLYFYIIKQKRYRLNDSITNLSLGIGNQVTGALTKSLIFGLVIWVYENYALFHIPNSWVSILICLVLYDFLYYWSHRWGHTVSLFWGAHIVHHQSEEYNLSVALRQSWFHNLLAFFIFLPLPLLGFDPLTIGIAGAVNLLYQFWIHTEAIRKLPSWFEFVFNTPSHHRVHHGINPEYIDKNHAGVFMFWDRMFGTFQAENETNEIQYGITTPLNSWNPAWANFHFYVELFDKMKTTIGIRRKLSLFFRKPGYDPSLDEVVPVPEITKHRSKYDIKGSFFIQLYCFAQFMIVTLGSIAYLGNFKELSLIYKLLFAAIIFFSIETIGGLFEQKTWAMYGELLRLASIAAVLNIFYYQFYPLWLKTMLIATFSTVGLFYATYVLLVLPGLTKLKV